MLSFDQVRQQVEAAWREVLPEADLDTGFFDQGGGSVSALLFVTLMETRLGVAVPYAELVKAGSAAALAEWIASHAEKALTSVGPVPSE
jgi:hypothetical protein